MTEVDVSVLEALLSTLPYPMLMAERMRALGLAVQHRVRPPCWVWSGPPTAGSGSTA